MSGVKKVLEAAGGSASAVARRLDRKDRPCKRQHVEYWVQQGYVPARWAPRVEREFGIPLHELNPSVYPAPSGRAA